MPYKILNFEFGYKVCKKNNPKKCFSNKPLTLEKAKKQLKAIGISEAIKKQSGGKLNFSIGSGYDKKWELYKKQKQKEEDYNKKFELYKKEQAKKKLDRLDMLKKQQEIHNAELKRQEEERNKLYMENRIKTDRITSNNLNYKNFHDKLGDLQTLANAGQFNPNDEEQLNKVIEELKIFIGRIEQNQELQNKMINDFNLILPNYYKGYAGYKAQNDPFYKIKKAVKIVAPIASLASSFIPIVGDKLSSGFEMANEIASGNKKIKAGCKNKINCPCLTGINYYLKK